MSASSELDIQSVAPTFADLAGPLDVTPVEGENLGGFLIPGTLLGRGGLGEVIECFDRDLRRTVALKRPVHPSRGAAVALLREAQITAQLIHPAIPAVHTIGVDEDQRPWFTMTRLHGGTLRRHLDGGLKWSVARRVRVILRIADALRYAHHRGVIHRDLKPDNIFVGEFGEIHVVDWGIAKVVGADDPIRTVQTSVPSRTRAGVFAGTVSYASPEQLRGEADLDARSDVYSLGALLHAVLVGRPPVVSDSAEAVRARVLTGDIAVPEPSDEVPAALGAVLRKALALDRSDRYASAQDFAADLEAYLDHRPVTAHDENPVAAFERWYNRRQLRITRSDKDLHVLGGAAFGAFAALVAVAPTEGLQAWLELAGAVGVAALGFYAVVRVGRLMGITPKQVARDWRVVAVLATITVCAIAVATRGLGLIPAF